MSLAKRCVNGVCVCVLPVASNDYRPLALRHRPLALVSGFLLIAKLVGVMALALTPNVADLSTITSNRIVQLTNAERVNVGLNELSVSPQLTAAAQQKGEHMLEEEYFAHISPSGVTPWFWMGKVGYSYQIAGENLAIDFLEAEDVVAAWLASPSHKDNMLHSSYTETGVAVVTGPFQGHTSTIVVHMFGLPTGAEEPAQTITPEESPEPAVEAEISPSPTPSPSPLVPPADTEAPPTPRISLLDEVSAVRRAVELTISGEASSTAYIQVNDTSTATIALNDSGTATLSLDVSGFDDGPLRIRAYARDDSGNTSGQTPPLQLTKDTTGPALAAEGITALVSPATDRAVAVVNVTASDIAELQVGLGEETITYAASQPVVVDATSVHSVTLLDELGNRSAPIDLTLLPRFSANEDTSFTTSPARTSRLVRWSITATAAVIVILLMLAIGINIGIQRPAMLGHACLILTLAAALLLL